MASKIFAAVNSEKCTRCSERVYPTEAIGPIKNSMLFHRTCFKCFKCNQVLALKTYFTNPLDSTDMSIYCSKDCPRVAAQGFDASAFGIRSALQVPSLSPQSNDLIKWSGAGPKIDADARHIRGALDAQSEFDRKNMLLNKHHFPALLFNAKKKEKLLKYQEQLEEKQRKEEDDMMKSFQEQRRQEAESLENEFNTECDTLIKNLQRNNSAYDRQVDEIKKNMTLKKMTKKEQLTLRLQRQAQNKTMDMVKRHSTQMLNLMYEKDEEITNELKSQLRDDILEDCVEIDEVLSSIHISSPSQIEPHPPTKRKRDLFTDVSVFDELDKRVFKIAESEQQTFTDLVRQLTEDCLNDLQKVRSIFRWITVKDLNVMEFDETINKDTPLGILRGIKFGSETYHTLFMRLCSYAGLPCQEIKGHSKSVGYEPGMPIREDTFLNAWNAVLVMGDWWPVQCNWAARHLVRNHQSTADSNKSKPDSSIDKIRYEYDEHYFLTDPDEFLYEFCAVDGRWQLVNRPITISEFVRKPYVRSTFFHHGLDFDDRNMEAVVHTDDKGVAELRLNYPPDFCDEIMFHYHLRFADRDRRRQEEHNGVGMERFVFHTVEDSWTMFTVTVPIPGIYFLEIFVNGKNEPIRAADPSSPDSISSPSISPYEHKLKCAVKLQIICVSMLRVMYPLPNCAPGEWGPAKARRMYAILPITHPHGIINSNSEILNIKLQLTRDARVRCKLYQNGVSARSLDGFVVASVVGNWVANVDLNLPRTGQYGLDIFTRKDDPPDQPPELIHVCKYLINCTRVSKTQPIPTVESPQPPPYSPPQRQPPNSPNSVALVPGPTEHFLALGFKAISHKESTIEVNDRSGTVALEVESANSDLTLTHQLITDRSEDFSHVVSIKDAGKRFKISATLPKPGNYCLKLYALKRGEVLEKRKKVYNYMIRFVESNSQRKKSFLKKTSFKKS